MNESGITIQCSPGTFATVQENPDLLEEILSNVQSEEVHAFKAHEAQGAIQVTAEVPGISMNPNQEVSMNYQEILDTIIDGENEDSSQSTEKAIWVDAAIKLLLSLVAEFRPKLGKSAKLKNKRKMWANIEAKMKESGYKFSAVQIENKYRGLERSFKKTKTHNKQTGRNRETCAYEKELGDILNDKPSVFPKYIVGSSIEEVMTRDDLISASTSSDPEQPAGETSWDTIFSSANRK